MFARLMIATAILLMALSPIGVIAEGDQKDQPEESAKVDSLEQDKASNADDKFHAYYFHGNRRCVTCRKLEAYSQEALEAGFKKEMDDSLLIWQPTNYDEEENKHFIDDYKLYTKALILSRIREGKEVEWMNLDKIWQLVRDKNKYIEYVQKETRRFIEGEASDE